MKLKINRDSVCAGDDIDDHDELRRYEPQMKFAFVIQSILNSGFLPIYEGSEAPWLISVDDKPVGVACGNWPKPRFTIDPDSPLQAICGTELSTVHFHYRCQEGAEALFASISG